MKKVVIAFVAGALLMASGQVIADSVSKIGKKIDGEAKVVLNNKPLSNAVISEGKSYAPVRDIAEALGATTSYSKGVIVIETKLSNDGLVEKLRSLNAEKAYVQKKISETEASIHEIKTVTIPFREERGIDTATGELRPDSLVVINELKESVAKAEIELIELKSKLVDINNQLNELIE
ncbi:hypothetical protein [Paenibacillus sinopodophylli]|uniref:hypothetical protein n=1 Tax=Paenibacillus sinopodophylli TaxID=1837342 RepID=UPI00110C924C|nr:hypothetical protein [Paenibacillus sinopodophylli]